MKMRLVVLGLAGAAVLALSGASVFAMAQGFGSGPGSSSNGYASMQAMHNSPAMQQAMAQFSPQLRAQCNAMNSQMSGYMSSHINGAIGSGMMGYGSGAGSGFSGYAPMQAMHNSPSMQQAMAKFSPQLRAQCNAMHKQMSRYMTSHLNGATGFGMMGGQTMGGR